MNMVRSMLSEKDMPKDFFPEAVKWSVFVQNRSPTVALKDVTPEEVWSEIKPASHFFRTFGCIGFVHVPQNRRKKLDSRSTKCVLLGISEESKTYRLYDPITKRILSSRYVTFSEHEEWNWKTDKSEGNTEIVDLGDERATIENSLQQAAEDEEPVVEANTETQGNERSDIQGNTSVTTSEVGSDDEDA